ncbi:NUC091 domain-containing protein [Chaetomium sp. MPI-SDFR-AT-0129]|uniref:Nucleolar GTP-binding protein 2 n=1 Tax=Dichotomopilus funicola TaxID=1934379 RepID=A0AAN6V435_9PEZI|nr:NUC091 domain-containing protein [Chaetomium sp. MPI-SDFR-AT-0129]KAK4144389.1 NUC091 domain-containing protein [Dichotomopilus funicola]
MGTGKKERSRIERQGKVKGDPKVKGENFYRSAKKIKTLNMYKDGKATRNKEGKVVQAASYQSKEVPKAVVEPNRRWFTNTRVISQDTLKSFREAIAEKEKDPYSVLLKSNKLPMSLIRDGPSLQDGLKKHQAKMTIESEPFSETFGPKAQRKRPKLSFNTVDELAGYTEDSLDSYQARLEQIKLLNGAAGSAATDGDELVEEDFSVATAKEAIFSKGQSKRIWNELYKVIDSSDVILHVIDARDPLGTRCRHVEKYLATEAPHKHLVFVLNKIDLVPSSTAAAWIRVLQKDHPTCAMRSSIKNPFGRGSLIDLLRQFSILHKDRKQISVGLIGYPNVGKSSIINALRGKAVAKVAPIPGETKVWQYVTLMKRIYLIDCPGIVPPNQNDTPQDLLLRGVVRVENVEHPEQYIPAVLKKVKTHHMERTYELKGWKDHIEFLELMARKSGRLLKGGEPDVDGVAKMVLNDFMRGKIPWFTPAPAMEGGDDAVVEGRQGRFGEMPLKRKRDDNESVAGTTLTGSTAAAEDDEDNEDEEEDENFSGFSSDSDSEEEDGPNAEAEAGGGADMIPLGDSSDEEDEEDSEDEQGSGEDDDEADDESDLDIEGASDVLPSEDESDPPVQKKRRKAR